MDVQHQGLGFFGTYIYFVYLPFVYTLQARYLVSHQPAMPYWYLVPIVVLNGEFWRKQKKKERKKKWSLFGHLYWWCYQEECWKILEDTSYCIHSNKCPGHIYKSFWVGAYFFQYLLICCKIYPKMDDFQVGYFQANSQSYWNWIQCASFINRSG